MNKRQHILISTLSILFVACSSSNSPVTPKSLIYKHGVSDGCKTANGTYTKNSKHFRKYKKYADGWFKGRRDCNSVR